MRLAEALGDKLSKYSGALSRVNTPFEEMNDKDRDVVENAIEEANQLLIERGIEIPERYTIRKGYTLSSCIYF